MSITTENIKKLRIFVQNHIRGTMAGDALVSFFKTLGVNDWFTRILYASEQKEPTQHMKNAEKYFAAQTDKTRQIAALFADDISREVYFAAIRYRTTHNPKDAPDFSKHDQYFVKDLVSLSDHEIFVDCGAFDGDTMKAFLKACHNRYQGIVCFEPVEKYHRRLQKHSKGKNVTALCAGVYKTSTTLRFNAEGGKGSSITSSGEHTILVPVCAIDDVPECKEATFIKMDIEGSELAALQGAKQTILRNRPKLAICIYHYNRDFIEIPEWIHRLVPEYKLYVRHHAFSVNETVLYAIPPES